jgi:uncharacterized membrane protein
MVNVRPDQGQRALLLFFSILLSLSSISCSERPRYAAPPLSGTDVVFDVASLPEEIPQFYTLPVRSRQVSFFVLRLPSGVQAYLDACITCFPDKRGYASRDGRVICRKCNVEFSVYKLEQGVGSCYPIKLKGQTKDGKFRIPVAFLEAEAGKF